MAPPSPVSLVAPAAASVLCISGGGWAARPPPPQRSIGGLEPPLPASLTQEMDGGILRGGAGDLPSYVTPLSSNMCVSVCLSFYLFVYFIIQCWRVSGFLDGGSRKNVLWSQGE